MTGWPLHQRRSGPAGFRTNSCRRQNPTLLTEPSSYYKSRETGLSKSDQNIDQNSEQSNQLPFDHKFCTRGLPKFRPNTFKTRCSFFRNSSPEKCPDKIVYVSNENNFNSRSNSPTFRKLNETKNYLFRAINVEMMDRFGVNQSLHSMETVCNPETDSLSISMQNICNYRGVKYPDSIFTKAVEERNQDWHFGPRVETVDEFKHPELKPSPQLKPPIEIQPVKRTILKLPDIGVLISPVRVKFRGNLHYAYKLADEMRFGGSQYNIDKWIEELRQKNEKQADEKGAKTKEISQSEVDFEIPVNIKDSRDNSYMIDLNEAMNRIESRLRSARMDEDSSYADASTSNLTTQKVPQKKLNSFRVPRAYNVPLSERKGKSKAKTNYSKGNSYSTDKKPKESKKLGKKKSKGGKGRKYYAGKKAIDDISGAVAFVSNPSTPNVKDEADEETETT